VADQLQTNYASDLRHILKAVFECNTSDTVVEKQTTTAATLQEFPEDRDNDASEEDLNYGYESSQPSVVNSRVTASQESVAGQQDSSDSSGKHSIGTIDSARMKMVEFWWLTVVNQSIKFSFIG